MKPANLYVLTELTQINKFLNNLKAVIMPFETMTQAPTGEYYIGVGRELSNIERSARAFAVDFAGHNTTLNNPKIEFILKNLDSPKIRIIPDERGMIYEDSQTNRVISFISGIGPIGASLGLIADLQTAYDGVKSSIKAQLTENQVMALASFVNSIGTESFINSEIPAILAQNNFYLVTRYMKGWVLNPDGSENPYLVAQREFESELFQCPDNIDIGVVGDQFVAGSLTYADLSSDLNAKRTNS